VTDTDAVVHGLRHAASLQPGVDNRETPGANRRSYVFVRQTIGYRTLPARCSARYAQRSTKGWSSSSTAREASQST